MNDVVLSVRELRTSARDLPVVRGVSFDVTPGETVAIVGESGSGKSITALSIMGLLPDGVRVTNGSVRVDGVDVLGLDEPKRRQMRGSELAMIYQDPMTSLNPLMRVGAQIAEGLRAHGVPSSEADQRTVKALGDVGLPRPELIVKSYPHQLSGGQRQRVMIAMAVALRPRVLIADEPTTALDVTIQQQILALADEMRRELGLALVWITHDLGVVARLAHRVLVMYAGQVVEAGSTRALYRAPQHPYTAGLIGSIPPILGHERPPLPQIGGVPPVFSALPAGCPFHPRCPQVKDVCRSQPPALEPHGDGLAACWVPRDEWVT